jgi:hypothetical protein
MRALALATLSALSSLALVGCAGGFTATPSAGAQQMVYSAESDFRAALRIAVTYENLPACAPAQHFPCADPSAVSKVTAAARAARVSLAAAEAAVRSSTNEAAMTTAAIKAQSDVAVFQALAVALKK